MPKTAKKKGRKSKKTTKILPEPLLDVNGNETTVDEMLKGFLLRYKACCEEDKVEMDKRMVDKFKKAVEDKKLVTTLMLYNQPGTPPTPQTPNIFLALRESYPVVEYLLLDHLPLLPAAWAALASYLQRQCKKLKHLMFDSVPFGPVGSTALGTALDAGLSVKMLRIANTALEASDLLHICKGLKKAPRLEALELQYCMLDEEAMKVLGTALSSPDTHVTRLSLKGNPMGCTGLVNLLFGLLEAETQPLEILDLSQAELRDDDEAFQLLREFAIRSAALKEIDLSGNFFGPNCAMPLLVLMETKATCEIKGLPSCLPSDLYASMITRTLENRKLANPPKSKKKKKRSKSKGKK